MIHTYALSCDVKDLVHLSFCPLHPSLDSVSITSEEVIHYLVKCLLKKVLNSVITLHYSC